MAYPAGAMNRPAPADEASDEGGSCRCDGGQPKNFAHPCLLLLLAEAPAHGYELIERMRPFGFDPGDPATIYRTLRQMERDGIVTSEWALPERGPARRVYALTELGAELLAAWAQRLEENRAIVDAFLARFEQEVRSRRPPAARIGVQPPVEDRSLQLAGGAR